MTKKRDRIALFGAIALHILFFGPFWKVYTPSLSPSGGGSPISVTIVSQSAAKSQVSIPKKKIVPVKKKIKDIPVPVPIEKPVQEIKKKSETEGTDSQSMMNQKPGPPGPSNITSDILSPGDLKTTYSPAPKYPAFSRMKEEEGIVILLIKVGPNGRVNDMKLERTSGYKRLDRAAQTAVQKWKFDPKSLPMLRRSVTVRIPIQFRLDDYE